MPVDRPRSVRIDGSATFSIATSIPSRKTAPASTKSTPQARAFMRLFDAGIDMDMVHSSRKAQDRPRFLNRVPVPSGNRPNRRASWDVMEDGTLKSLGYCGDTDGDYD